MKKNYLLCGLLLSMSSLQARPGDLDTSFGGQGVAPHGVFAEMIMTNTFDIDNEFEAVLMQPDRKIVFANDSGSTVRDFVRLNPNGRLDNTFGNGGIASIDFTPLDGSCKAIVLQIDGKLVMLNDEGALARVTSRGNLDPSFGVNGIVDFNFLYEKAETLLLTCDQEFIVVGEFDSIMTDSIIISKHLSDGSLDSKFGNSGVSRYGVDGNLDDTIGVLQKDGKIVVASMFSSSGGGDDDLLLVRFLPDGTLDTSFNKTGAGSGIPGVVIYSFPDTDIDDLVGITLQKDGKILVGFEIDNGPSEVEEGVGVVRFNTDGSVDRTYNRSGFEPGVAIIEVISPVGYPYTEVRGLHSMTIQVDGKLIVAFEAAADDDSDSFFALARLNINGTLDASFGSKKGNKPGTIVYPHFLDGADDEQVFSLVLQADGKIIVGGDSEGSGAEEFALAIRVESGVEVSKVAQAIFGKYALTSDYNRTVCYQ